MKSGLLVGIPRFTHYSITYHLVWIPKYRRRVLTGEVQVETNRLITECCEKQGLTLFAIYVGTAGAVSAETIKRYITECQGK